ncbi:MAG: HAMP domain-containing sensor histidine kinase [Candidatus Nitrosocosmicus sp.]
MDTKIISSIQDITETIVKFYTNVSSRCDGYGITTGTTLMNESRIIKNIILHLKSKGIRLRIITEVTPDNIEYCKEIMSNIELRHLEGVKGGMAVSDTEYITTSTIKDGESGTQLFYSNGRQIVEQQQHIFEIIWDKSTPAEQKILQIEQGLKPEVVDIVNDPLKSRNMFIDNLKSSKEEILLLLPSFKSFDNQKKMGLLKIDNYLPKTHNIKIKILVNHENQVYESSSKFLSDKQLNNTSIRYLLTDTESNNQSHTVVIIIDKKTLLILELKGDYQDSFEKSIKFLVYSNNKSIVLSNAIIFDALWDHAELVKQFKHINEKLQLQEFELEKQIVDKTQGLRIIYNDLKKSNIEISNKEENLRKINKELINAEKSKSEFISMLSHELRTPLVPIKGYAEMLLKPQLLGELNEKQLKAIQSIYRNIKKQESLVDDVLDSAKLDLGQLYLSKKEVTISDLFANVMNDSKHMAEEKKVSLSTHINTKTKNKIYCDEKRIEQVLSNLIKNSIDFVAKKEGKIMLTIDDDNSNINNNSDNSGILSNVVFTVKDNGKGIPKDKMDNLFKRFYQIDSSRTRKHGGSGLGLAICKGIVEAHGGRIWIDDNHSKGVTIKFTIPNYTNSSIKNKT